MNEYVQAVLGYETQHPTESVLAELWKVTEEIEKKVDVGEGNTQQQQQVASSSSSPPPRDRELMLLEVVKTLGEIEDDVMGQGRAARYRFLSSKYESRLPNVLKVITSSLVTSVSGIDSILTAAVSEVCNTGYRRKVDALSADISVIKGHFEMLKESLHGVCTSGDDELYNVSSELLMRNVKKTELGVKMLKLCCSMTRHDKGAVCRHLEDLENTEEYEIEGEIVRQVDGAARGFVASWGEVSLIRAEIERAVETITDAAAMKNVRTTALAQLDSLNIPEVEIHEITRGVTSAIDRILKTDEAREMLKTALKHGTVSDVKSAVKHADEVGMKDVDGILTHAEKYIEQKEEVDRIVAGLSIRSDAPKLLQAIVAANTYLKANGLFIEGAAQFDANGKLIPKTTDEYDMYLDHFNNNLWTHETSVTYQEACILYGQNRVVAAVSTEIQDLMNLPDDDFSRVGVYDNFEEILGRCDESGYHTVERNVFEKRIDAVLRIRLKIFYPQGDIKVLTVPQRIRYKALHDALVAQYQADNPELDDVAFKISYMDAEEDRIRMTTDGDWKECVSVKRSAPPTATMSATYRPGDVRVELYLDYNFMVKKKKEKLPSPQPCHRREELQEEEEVARCEDVQPPPPPPPPPQPRPRASSISKWTTPPTTTLPEVPDTSFILPKQSTFIEDSIRGVGVPRRASYPCFNDDDDDNDTRPSQWEQFKASRGSACSRGKPGYSRAGIPLDNKHGSASFTPPRRGSTSVVGKPRPGGKPALRERQQPEYNIITHEVKGLRIAGRQVP